VQFKGCEIITQKKLTHVPGVPLAVRLSSPNLGLPVASDFAANPSVAPVANAQASVVGSKAPMEKPTILIKPVCIASEIGGARIRATGVASAPKLHRLSMIRLICAGLSKPFSREIPAMRYKIPGRRMSLLSLG
jgi:hypothetical protein